MVWELTKDIAGAAVSAWDKAAALRTAWINRNGFLHAYHFEVHLNLDLLAAVKRDRLAGVSAGSPACAAVRSRLNWRGFFQADGGSFEEPGKMNHKEKTLWTKRHLTSSPRWGQ
jgi:hypothetical protein